MESGHCEERTGFGERVTGGKRAKYSGGVFGVWAEGLELAGE